jgi:hypothetical protein
MKSLRDGLPDEPDAIATLTQVACEYGDQAVQKAAIGGLAKHGTPEAVAGIAQRLLDSWGMGVITCCIKACGRMADHGGLLILAATLFQDNRFIGEKLEVIKKVLQKGGDQQSLDQLDRLGDEAVLFREPKLVNGWLEAIREVANLDVKHGATFGSQYDSICGWQANVMAVRPENEVSQANAYVDSRIPGLQALFDSKLTRKPS